MTGVRDQHAAMAREMEKISVPLADGGVAHFDTRPLLEQPDEDGGRTHCLSDSVATLSAEEVGWHMRAIKDAKERIAEEHATHQKYRDKLAGELALIDEAEAAAIHGDQERIAYFEAQLTAHLLNKRAADPSVKSVTTPWGTVSSREQQPDYQRNEDVLFAWADEYDRATFTKTQTITSLNWEAIKKECHVRGEHLVLGTGEIVPGVTVVGKPLKVTVKCAP